jgi:hypothetical protein
MTRNRTLAAGTLAAALLLAACGGDDGGAEEGTTAPPAETSTSAEVETSTTAEEPEDAEPDDGEEAGAIPDACSLVEPAEVEALVGAAEPEGETETAIDGLEYSQCIWETDDAMLVVAVVEGEDRFAMHGENLPAEPLEGVGDEAITAPGVSSETRGATGGRTISALVDGNTLVVALRVPGETSIDLVAPIATTIAGRLGS